MQLPPRFSFNTLISIAALVKEGPKTANSMLVTLGETLRLTLEDKAVEMYSLRDKLEFERRHAGIEKLQLGDRTRIEYNGRSGSG